MSQDRNQPRKIDKRKHHSRGFDEGVVESRAARVSFKLYLRELEEQSIEDFDLYEAADLPSSEDECRELYDSFLSENQECVDIAREKESAEDGAEYLMDELRKWLISRGQLSADVDTWLESDIGNDMFDMFWNGLT